MPGRPMSALVVSVLTATATATATVLSSSVTATLRRQCAPCFIIMGMLAAGAHGAEVYHNRVS